jgi:leucyl aminopeptidase
MERKNIYEFNILETINNNYKTIVVLCYLDYIKKDLETILKISIPEKLHTIYKGSKGKCEYFYINDIKYVLMIYSDNYDDIAKMSGIVGKSLIDTDESKTLIVLCHKDLSKAINYILQGAYIYEELKTIKPKTIVIDIHSLSDKEEIKKIIEQNKILYEIKDLINMPVNLLNSSTYESHIRKNINSNINCRVLNKSDLQSEGLNLILAVNQASNQEPKLVILDYNPSGSTNKPICLVGKGVMYDTGGLNLKYPLTIEMKTDMTGSAMVYGILKVLSLYGYNKRIIGLLPIVQNDIGSNAIHVGDVIKSYSGKTVEISDTDAEGRLILADAIAYTKNFNPSLIIDMATLTGQACSIFDSLATVIMGNNNQISRLINIGQNENEKFWQLPLWPEYIKLTKSKLADYINYNTKTSAGAINGGAFIYNFLPEKSIPWIHLDLGSSYLEDETSTKYEGATGDAFNSLIRFLLELNIDDIKITNMF